MGCPTSCVLGEDLVFSVTTHDPDTGVLTDADSVPSYRIYEDETTAAILNGSMAKLDDVNTTGFYSELIAVTAGNGFEAGKNYTVYIEATVDSDTGGISYAFKVTPAVPDANAVQINDSAAAAAQLALSAIGIVSGAAILGTLSTTQMTTDLTEATDDHYIGGVIVWTSGALAGQRSDVTDYDGAVKMLTYTATTDAPSAADTFVII